MSLRYAVPLGFVLLSALVGCTRGRVPSGKSPALAPLEQQKILSNAPTVPDGSVPLPSLNTLGRVAALPPAPNPKRPSLGSQLAPADPTPAVSPEVPSVQPLSLQVKPADLAAGSSILGISGTVLSSGDGRPVIGAGISVSITNSANNAAAGTFSATTDAKGDYGGNLTLSLGAGDYPALLALQACGSDAEHQKTCQTSYALLPSAGTAPASLGTLVLTYLPPAAPIASAPTGLMPYADSVAFQWQSVSGNVKYSLLLTDITTGSPLLSVNGIAGTVFTAMTTKGAIPPGHQLSWFLQAVGDHGAGPWSQAAGFILEDVPKLVAPSGVIAAIAPALSWTPCYGASSYQIWLSDLTAGTNTQASSSGPSYPTGNLVSGHLYRWWVRTVYGNGSYSVWSSSLDFIAGVPVPRSPIGTIPVDSGTLQTLNADPVPGAISFEFVTYNLNPYQEIFDAVSPVSTYTTVFPAGTPLRWWVRAAFADGSKSPWSSPADFIIAQLAPPALNSPLNAVVASLTPTFSWQTVSGAAHYAIQVIDKTSGGQMALYSPAVSGTSWVADKNLMPGHAYQWFVLSIDDTGTPGNWSPEGDFSLSPLSAPTLAAPSGPTAGNQPTFTWNPSFAADNYQLQVVDTSSGNTVVISDDGVKGTSEHPSITLMVGHTYSWSMRAISLMGEISPWSPSTSFSITSDANAPSLVPLAPQVLKSGSSQTFTLSASPSGAAITYSAHAETQLYVLNRTLGICFTGNDYFNWGGQGEKWLRGQHCTGSWYYLKPNGELYQWLGGNETPLTGALIAQLQSAVYTDPSQLYNATSNASLALAAQTAQSLPLSCDGGYQTNAFGANEKWVRAANGDWYFLLPDGSFWKWNGDAGLAIGMKIAGFDTSIYNDPTRLCKAGPYTSPATVNVTGNQVTVDVASSFTGTFYLILGVSDGISQSSSLDTFLVTNQ